MDSKLLLVKIITLLYCESKLGDRTLQSQAVCKEAIGTIRQAETTLDTAVGREISDKLRSTALWMCNNTGEHVYEKSSFIQRLRLNLAQDEQLFEIIERGINVDIEPLGLKQAVFETRREIRDYFNQIKIKEIMTSSWRQIAYQPEKIEWDSYIRDHVARLEPFMGGTESTVDGLIDGIRLSNLDAGAEIMRKAKEQLSTNGVLKWGKQGLNRMFGICGGGRRGEFVLIGALPHQYKSGIMLDMFRWACTYNTPYMRDKTGTKKPVMVFMSFENELGPNLIDLYCRIKENETGIKVDKLAIDETEAMAYIYEKLTATGYEIEIVRYDPSNYTFQKLFDYVISLEMQGLEVHGIFCDYMAMMSKKGCDMSAGQSEAIRDLYRRVRNFMAPKGIFFMTPHQLSPDARKKVREGTTDEDFVKQVAGGGFYSGSTQIDQEVDMEIVIHLVKVNGRTYLTMQRGKHRYNVTPEKDQFVVFELEPICGLTDDIGKPDTARRSVGGGTAAEGGGDAFWA